MQTLSPRVCTEFPSFYFTEQEFLEKIAKERATYQKITESRDSVILTYTRCRPVHFSTPEMTKCRREELSVIFHHVPRSEGKSLIVHPMLFGYNLCRTSETPHANRFWVEASRTQCFITITEKPHSLVVNLGVPTL